MVILSHLTGCHLTGHMHTSTTGVAGKSHKGTLDNGSTSGEHHIVDHYDNYT